MLTASILESCFFADGDNFLSTLVLTPSTGRQEAHERSGAFTVPQIFINGIYVGDRDKLKAITDNFDVPSIQNWFSKNSTSSAHGAQIVPTKMGGEEGVANQASTVPPDVSHRTRLEELAWKSSVIRSILGFEQCAVPMSRIREIIGAEKWAFGKDEADTQIRLLASAGVFQLPGRSAAECNDASVPLPHEVLLGKLHQINGLMDFLSVAVEARSADDIVAKLREVSVILYEKLLFSEGHGVRFENVSDFPALWKTFLGLFMELQQISGLEDKSVSFRTAFFINLYNIFHFAASAIVGSPKTSTERMRFFALTVQIGQHSFSLDDIEHGILRGVRFEAWDPRAKFVVPLDPRIHFALNCGAKSCPAISVYSSEEHALKQELAWATAAFCSENVSCSENTVTVSRLFSWYRNDFVSVGNHSFCPSEILQWIVSHGGLDHETELYCTLSDMLARMAKNKDHHIKLRWQTYEWARAEERDSYSTASSSSSAPNSPRQSPPMQTGLVASMAKSDIFFHLRRRQEKRFVKSRKTVALDCET